MIGSFVKNGDLIIYESTIFPGCTEEILIPLLEKISKKKLNKNFLLAIHQKELIQDYQNLNLLIKQR